MPTKVRTYTPSAVDTDGIVDGATGATSPIAQVGTSAGDGLAHKLSLTSSANLSGITFTIVGTDENGRTISEAIAGPNNNTIETTSYFMTVASIAISATLGANTVDVGWVDEFVTPTIGHGLDELVSAQVLVSGTINYTFQQTLSELQDTSITIDWFDCPESDLVQATTSQTVAYPHPICGTRIKVSSYSSGASLRKTVVRDRRR